MKKRNKRENMTVTQGLRRFIIDTRERAQPQALTEISRRVQSKHGQIEPGHLRREGQGEQERSFLPKVVAWIKRLA